MGWMVGEVGDALLALAPGGHESWRGKVYGFACEDFVGGCWG